jgi:hypothetical protein
MNETCLKSFKVIELRKQCENLNLHKTGKKQDLLDRLLRHSEVHNNKIIRQDDTPPKAIKVKKKRISPIIRFKVWEKYIGNKIKAKCFCCWENDITPFTNNNTFHAGHILAESNGGEIELENLLPICQDCNKSMNTTHWDDWVKFNLFPLRIWGSNIPKETHLKATQIQKYWKNYKKLKFIKENKKNKKNKKKVNYMRQTISSKKKRKYQNKNI